MANSRREPLVIGLIIIALALPVLAACGSPSGTGVSPSQSGASAAESMSSAQRSALADGEVSRDEYLEGFRRFSACLAADGYTIADPRTDQEVIDFGVPAAAVDSGADKRCYEQEFESIDIEWQVAHEDTSETAKLAAECLTSHGIQPEQRLSERLAQLEKAGIDFASQCP